jgi:peptidoglycan/LPS O-acetylase OafA/YrhL
MLLENLWVDEIIIAGKPLIRREEVIRREAVIVTESRGEKIATVKYYPWFDWLRLVLACVVMLSHEGLIQPWPQAGDFAVQIFFALSGWLIGGILLTLPKRDVLPFYFNRALRIWCPYFLALALFVSASLLRDPVTPKWREFIFYKATFVYNLFGTRQLAEHRLEMPLIGTGNHFWSVNAEEQFYLVAPLLLVLVSRRFGRSVFTWIAIAALTWFGRVYASIAFGVLAAVIADAYGAFHKHYLVRILAGAVVAGSAIGFVAGADYDMLSPLCAIAVVLLLAINGNQHPAGALAGGMSYPLYLNAWIPVFVVNFVFKRVGLANPFARHTLILTLNLAMAAFLYWFIDRRLHAIRRRLYTPGRARVVAMVAYGTVAAGVSVGVFLYGR